MPISKQAALIRKGVYKEYKPHKTGREILEKYKSGWVGTTTGATGGTVGLAEFLGKNADQLENDYYQYSQDSPPIRPGHIRHWITLCCFRQIHSFQKNGENGATLCDYLKDIVLGKPTPIRCPACDCCSCPTPKRTCNGIYCYIRGPEPESKRKRKRLGHLLVRR